MTVIKSQLFKYVSQGWWDHRGLREGGGSCDLLPSIDQHIGNMKQIDLQDCAKKNIGGSMLLDLPRKLMIDRSMMIGVVTQPTPHPSPYLKTSSDATDISWCHNVFRY